MADQIFRREWDYLMNVFGEPTLGWYYPDYKDAVFNTTTGEITGGKVYLIKQCSMRGLVLEDPVTFRNLQDGSGDIQFLGLDQACVFKVSATDLIKGGVLNAEGNYVLEDDPSTPNIREGIFNHKYVMYRGQLFEVVNFDRGVIFRGDPSNAYITTTRDVNYTILNGKAELIIQDTPVDPPDPQGYTVTVDGELLGTYLAGSTVTLTVPSKPGYQFNGWSSTGVAVSENNTFIMPEYDVVITSLWTADTFTVTIVNPGTGGNKEVTVENGNGVTLSAGTYTGHNFSKWVLSSGSGDLVSPTSADTVFYPTSDATVTAEWVEIADPRKTVTFVGITRDPEKFLAGDTVRVYAGTKEGYTFTRWTSDPAVTFSPRVTSANVSFTMPDSDVTVTAVWSEVPDVTIKFWLNSDTSDEVHNLWNTVVVKAGAPITDPGNPSGSAVPSGYTFNGWYTAAEGGVLYNLSSGTQADLDLFAHWKGVDRTVTFDTNGGNTIEPRIVENGQPIGELPVPTKEGFTFIKWTDELGREEIYPTTIVDSDMTIVAVWEEVVSGEVSRIDLNSDVVIDFATGETVFKGGAYFDQSPNPNTFTREHFYTGDWGLETPPAEFVETWAAKGWHGSTVQTSALVGQQVAMTLYRHDKPTVGATGYPMGLPKVNPVSTYTYITMNMLPVSQSATLPKYADGSGKMLVCLNVVDIGEGWYRYEFGWVSGVPSATNATIKRIFPGINDGSYDVKNTIPLD